MFNIRSSRQLEKLNSIIKECEENTEKTPRMYFLYMLKYEWLYDELILSNKFELWNKLSIVEEDLKFIFKKDMKFELTKELNPHSLMNIGEILIIQANYGQECVIVNTATCTEIILENSKIFEYMMPIN